jgi:hypothetical protein
MASLKDVKASLQCGACLNWFSSPTLLREHQEACSCYVLTYEPDNHHEAGGDEDNLDASGAGVEDETAGMEVLMGSAEEGVVAEGEEENYVVDTVRWGDGEIIVSSGDLEEEDSLSQMTVAPV